MAADFVIKEGDRLPTIQSILKANDIVVDLTGATVKFLMSRQGTLKVNASATVLSAAAGSVEYVWALADTDTAGQYQAEWEVTFASGKKETFPNPNYLKISVVADLG